MELRTLRLSKLSLGLSLVWEAKSLQDVATSISQLAYTSLRHTNL